MRVADQGFVAQGDHAIGPSALETACQLHHLKPFVHKTLKVWATDADVIGATGLGLQQPHFLSDDQGRHVALVAHRIAKARLGEDFPQHGARRRSLGSYRPGNGSPAGGRAFAVAAKDEGRESAKILVGEAEKIAIIVIDKGVVGGLPLIVFGKRARDILKQPIREMLLAGAVDGGVPIQHKLHPCGAGFRRTDHKNGARAENFW